MRVGIRLLARRWLATAVPRIADLQTASAVLRAHREHGQVMKQLDLSACWNKLGRLARDRTEGTWLRAALRRDATLLVPLLDDTLRQCRKPRPLANTVHGMAAVTKATGFDPGEAAWNLLAAEVTRRPLRDFKPQDLANTVWAYASAGHASPSLFDAVAVEVTRRPLRDFNPQTLANIAWAHAVADAPSAALFGHSDFTDRCAALGWRARF